jgi:hypothetical protein
MKLHGCLAINKNIRWNINLHSGLRPMFILIGLICTQMSNVKLMSAYFELKDSDIKVIYLHNLELILNRYRYACLPLEETIYKH